MSSYRPSDPFSVPMQLLVPVTTNVSGVVKKTYSTNGFLFFGTFKSYGGTERDVNGIYSIEDTASIETWYNPSIKSDCRVQLEDGRVFDIINEPEDISLRHQFMKFKVRRVKGGV